MLWDTRQSDLAHYSPTTYDPFAFFTDVTTLHTYGRVSKPNTICGLSRTFSHKINKTVLSYLISHWSTRRTPLNSEIFVKRDSSETPSPCQEPIVTRDSLKEDMDHLNPPFWPSHRVLEYRRRTLVSTRHSCPRRVEEVHPGPVPPSKGTGSWGYFPNADFESKVNGSLCSTRKVGFEIVTTYTIKPEIGEPENRIRSYPSL